MILQWEKARIAGTAVSRHVPAAAPAPRLTRQRTTERLDKVGTATGEPHATSGRGRLLEVHASVRLFSARASFLQSRHQQQRLAGLTSGGGERGAAREMSRWLYHNV